MTDHELLNAISDIFDKKFAKNFENAFDKKFDEKLEPIYNKLEKLDSRLENVEDTQKNLIIPRLKSIGLTQENEVLPRLQNIEACYISTSLRYQKSVDTYETMESDISILKTVVAHHSEALQKIS